MARFSELLVGSVLFVSTAVAAFIPKITTFGSTAENTTASVSFASQVNNLDAPYISAVTASDFEWWYFDAVSRDQKTALVIIFFATTPNAFPLVGNISSDVSVAVFATYPNGTSAEYLLPASSAQIASNGFLRDAAVGNWVGANAGFWGSPDLGEYAILFDFTEPYGIKGGLTFTSVAPAHYPCSSSIEKPNQNLEILPHIGWANAMPDANVTGSFSTTGKNGQTFTMDGAVGYHDKNWEMLPSFCRSQLVVGPRSNRKWSVVFFAGTDITGKAFATGYTSNAGSIVSSECLVNGTTVTPVMKGENLQALNVSVTIGGGMNIVMEISADNNIALAPGVYGRWSGAVNATVDGKKLTGGVSVFERFYPLS